MAKFISREYNKAIHGDKLNISDLYLLYNGQYFDLSLLTWIDERTRSRIQGDINPYLKNISSVEQFEKLVEDTSVMFYLPEFDRTKFDTNIYSADGGRITATDVKNNGSLYLKSIIDALNSYTSTTIEPSGSVKVSLGFERTVEFKDEKWSENDAYVMVKLTGDKDVKFFKKSELFVFKGTSKVSLDKVKIEEIKDDPIFAPNNRSVEFLYNDFEYSVGQLLSYNRIDRETMHEQILTLMPDSSKLEEDKPDETVEDIYQVTSTRLIPKFFSVQTPVSVTEPDGKNPDSTRVVHKIKSVNYELSKDGENILVKPKYAGEETIVSKKDLFMDEECKVSVENLSFEDLVGRKLYYKFVDGENITPIELEPITARQSLLTYSKITSLQEVSRTNSVFADNAYLKLEDGTPVLEKDLAQPIGYCVIEDQKSDDFDHYIVIGDDGESYIVSKNTFDKSTTIEKEENGTKVTLRRDKAHKVKRELDLNKAHIVQTTSTVADVEDKDQFTMDKCKLMGTFEDGKFKGLEGSERTNVYGSARADFEEQYKKGLYNLSNRAMLNGKEVKLDPDRRRFVETDTTYMQDYGHDYYDTVSNKPLVFSEKDGRINLEGGPKFDAKKANSKFVKKWTEITLTSVLACSMGGGFLGLLAVPVVLSASVATIAVGGPIAAIVNAIRAHNANKANHKWKDKTEINQPKWADDLQEELSEEFSNMLTYSKTHELSEESVRATFQSYKSRLAALGASRFNAGLRLDNQIANIDENNAAVAHNLQMQIQPRIEERTEVESQLEKDKKLLQKLSAKKGKLFAGNRQKRINELAKSITENEKYLQQLEIEISGYSNSQTQGLLHSENEEREQLERRLERAQAFVLTKGCKLTEGLSEEEVSLLDELEYDIATDKYFAVDPTNPEIRQELDLLQETKYTTLINKIMQSPRAEIGNIRKDVVQEVPEEHLEDEEDLEKEAEVTDEHKNGVEQAEERERIVVVEDGNEEQLDKIKKLQEAKEKLEQEKRVLEEKIAQLEKNSKNSQQLKDLYDKLARKGAEIEGLLNDIEQYKKTIETLKTLKNQQKERIDLLEKSQTQLLEENKKLKQVQEEFNKVQEQVRALIAEKKALEEKLSSNSQLNASEIAELKKLIAEKNTEIENLSKNLKTLGEQVKTLTSENVKLKEENDELYDEIERNLQLIEQQREKIIELKNVEQKCKELQSKLALILAEKLEAENKIKELSKTLGDKDSQISSLQEVVNNCNQKISELENSISELQNMIANITAEKDKLEKENQELAVQISALQGSIESREKVISELTKNLEELTKLVDKLSTENASLIKENEKKNSLINQMIQRQMERLNKTDKVIEDLNKRITALEKEVQSKKAEYDRLSKRIAAKEKAETLNPDLQNFRKELRAITAKIEAIDEELTHMQIIAEEFDEIWVAGSTEEGDKIDEKNKLRLTNIANLRSRNTKVRQDVDTMYLSNVKKEEDFNTKINSEDALKQLLEDRDPELLKYLADQGVNISDANITATIARISEKHQANTSAMSRANTLKNKAIYDILLYGQTYITDLATESGFII